MSDVYSIVTERMIALLEAGTTPWRKTWRGGERPPQNLISKKPYRGVNTLLLGSTSFASPYWLTFNQVQQLSGRVKKGAKSELVIFWKFFESRKETDDPQSSEQPSKRRRPILRYYRVFNVEQTEGLEKHLPPPPEEHPFTPIEAAARIVEGMPQRLPIQHDEPSAYYAPARDFVNLLRPETFDTPENYYAVAFHELTHSTGHESRINRAGVAGSRLAAFGSADYSREELVAEIGSAFLCAEAGIESTLDNSAAYLKGLLIPVRDVEGRIEEFQIRRADVKDESPRYVWLSSSNKLDGTSSGAPVHFRNVERMRGTGRAIITEGALKGDIIAHYMDRGVITVQGVSSFREDFGVKLREQIPELREVSIAFDADYARNPNVERALIRLSEALKQAGLEIETLKWAEGEGKGLDDYLKNRLTEHFYCIKGEERASIQEEVFCEIGLGDNVEHAESSLLAASVQKNKALDEDRAEGRLRQSGQGIGW